MTGPLDRTTEEMGANAAIEDLKKEGYTPPKKENVETEDKKAKNKAEYGPEEIENAVAKFQSLTLMHDIFRELDGDHVGDDLQKMLAFMSVSTAYMKPKYRISFRVCGNSTSGKDNLMRAILKHMDPDIVGHYTCQSDKWLARQCRGLGGLYVGELNLLRKGANANILELLKAAIEGGIKHAYLDKDEHGHIMDAENTVPQMMVVYSGTEIRQDDELSTRVLSISVDGGPEQTRAVLEKLAEKDELSNPDNEEYHSWIKIGLSQLKCDVVVVPREIKRVLKSHADAADVRARRDYKRLLAEIRSSAWLNQLQRPIENGAVVAVVADVYYALKALGGTLDQSYTGLEPRLQRVVDELVAHGAKGDVWVKQQEIIEKLGLKGKNRQADVFRTLKDQLVIRSKKVDDDKRMYECQLTGRLGKRFIDAEISDILAEIPSTCEISKPICQNQDIEPLKIGLEKVEIGLDAFPATDFLVGDFVRISENQNRNTDTYLNLSKPIIKPIISDENRKTDTYLSEKKENRLNRFMKVGEDPEASAVSEQKTPGPVFAMPAPAHASEVKS